MKRSSMIGDWISAGEGNGEPPKQALGGLVLGASITAEVID